VTPAPVILVAENNDDDFVLLRCAFESAGLPHRLIGVPNGVDAINYLFADEPFTNRSAYPFPELVLLDIHMYLMDGIEVLAALKERIEFRHLPIVVLSSVEEPKIIREALKLGAKDYLVKPITMEERIGMVRALDSRWLKTQRQTSSVQGKVGPTNVVGHRNFNPWSIQSLGQNVPPQPPRKKRT
jgi:two-component system, response regulator